MKTNIVPTSADLSTEQSQRPLDRLARRTLCTLLRGIHQGQLILVEGNREWRFGELCAELPEPVRVEILSPRVWRNLLLGGMPAAGESYIRGDWRCATINQLVRLLLRNRAAMDRINRALRPLRWPLSRLSAWVHRNTRVGSRRNIGAHYDIGNELFSLFLDPTMMYSCAYYPSADATLEQASIAKLDRICRKLQLSPDMHLLEIGTGWGGLAIHAAKHYGCRVTTTTISRAQYELARERVEAAGLSDRIELLLQDYRDLEGRYDRIVSIEMIEAVGHQFMGRYFGQCDRLLKANGLMLLQAITINDQHYQQALREVDFIKRYIFPGGFLPSISAISEALTRSSSMRIAHLEDIGLHYARTLQDWRERFMQRLEQVRELGYPEAFVRMWDYYFGYCQGGFEQRHLGTVQVLLSKTDARPADIRF